MTALQAVRREIADCKRTLTRLKRAEEILTGQRGIAAAPADKPPKAPSRPKQKRAARSNGLKPGQLAARVEALMADGQPHTVPELQAALGRNPDTATHLYRVVQGLDGVRRTKRPGRQRDTFQVPHREMVIRPGEGATEGRITGSPIA